MAADATGGQRPRGGRSLPAEKQSEARLLWALCAASVPRVSAHNHGFRAALKATRAVRLLGRCSDRTLSAGVRQSPAQLPERRPHTPSMENLDVADHAIQDVEDHHPVSHFGRDVLVPRTPRAVGSPPRVEAGAEGVVAPADVRDDQAIHVRRQSVLTVTEEPLSELKRQIGKYIDEAFGDSHARQRRPASRVPSEWAVRRRVMSGSATWPVARNHGFR